MDQRTFHNLLRVLTSIDHHEVPFLDEARWQAFRTDPYRFFVRCDDETCDLLWAVMQERTTRRAA